MKHKMSLKKIFTTLGKGAVIGGTMLVPGVSGGSMAMILGIYQELVSAVSSFYRNKKYYFMFLFMFCIGAAIGMVLIATPISHLIDLFPRPTMYFFIGAVAGGIPLIVREARVCSFSWKYPLYIIVGGILIFTISLLPATATGIWEKESTFQIFLLFAVGIVAAVALILPGISVSHLLLLFGLYDRTMEAIRTLQLPFLLPLLFGGIVGIILTAKFLEKVMICYPQPTYLIILGCVIGSVISIFPGFPSAKELIICVLTFVGGFVAVYLLSKKNDVYTGTENADREK